MNMILSKKYKADLENQLAMEVNITKNEFLPSKTTIFNRPMTFSQIHRNKKYMRLIRTIFALYMTLSGRLINIHSQDMSISVQTCLLSFYFLFTFLIICMHVLYFKTVTTIYRTYTNSINTAHCASTELIRVLHYISLPVMFTLVLLKSKRNHILITYALSIFILFLSNMFDKYDKKQNMVLKLASFISTIILFDIFFGLELYLKGYLKNILHVGIVPCIIFCSIFMATQVKSFDDVIRIPFRDPTWVNKLPNCFFYTSLYLANIYENSPLNIPLVCINVLLSLGCLFKPFLFDSFQLLVEDEQNQRILRNLDKICTMFEDVDLQYTTVERYYKNLRIRLVDLEAENMFSGLLNYLSNRGCSEPGNLIKAIEDFSCLKPNKNIIFVDGLFVYSYWSTEFGLLQDMKVKFPKKKSEELKVERLRNCILMQYLLMKTSQNIDLYFDVNGYIERCLKNGI